jgi:fumarate hydratase class II
MENDVSGRSAGLQLCFITEAECDRVVDRCKMVKPYVAAEPSAAA